MKNYLSLAFAFFLFAFALADRTSACTTFCLKNKTEVLFGRNYDWMIGDGLVFVNKRNLSKKSNNSGAENPAQWVSRFGSVTFNQYGRENPMGGINEAGLVVELMWLDEARYPEAFQNPTVDVLEWVQYNLDTAATVEEVLQNAENLRIVSRVTLHYLVSDKNGNSAAVEFLEGKLVARTGEKLPVAALANDTYEKSLNYAKTVSAEKAGSESSFDRFTRAAQKTKEFESKPLTQEKAVAFAFESLAGVAQKDSTQWSIVYDPKRGRIHFRTRQNPEIKTIDIKAFDYSCGSSVKILDINSKEAGDVTAKFTDYTAQANRRLIEQSFSRTPFLKDVPPAAKDFIASYPENFACDTGERKTAANSVQSNETGGLFGFFQSIYRFFFGV